MSYARERGCHLSVVSYLRRIPFPRAFAPRGIEADFDTISRSMGIMTSLMDSLLSRNLYI
jgi:hypothetical protein